MRYTLRYIYWLFLLIPLATSAQHEHWKWKQFGIEDGLVNTDAYCVAEDSLGYIWVGTNDGLSRFDGTFFTNFQMREGDSTSLVDNRVRFLHVEPGGNVLVGTISGMSMFDYQTGKFVSHNFDSSEKGEELNNFIRGFQCWPDGHIWVYTLCNVYDWNRSTHEFTMLDKSLKSTKYGAGPVTLRHPDPYKCWLSSPDGIALVDYESKSATLINPHGDVFERTDKPLLMESCTQDRYGKIWYNSVALGTFYCYDPTTNGQRAFRQDTIEYGRRSAISTMCMYADHKDRLWVSTWSTEPYILDTLHHKRLHFQVTKYKMEPDPHLLIRSYFQSKNGDMWIAGNFGLSVHAESMEAVRTSLLPKQSGVILPHDQQLNALLADKLPGNFYVATSNGLFFYSKALDHFEFFQYSQKSQDASVNELIWMNDKILCGTGNGLFLFDPTTKRFEKWKTSLEKLNESWITGILLKDDALYVTTGSACFFIYSFSARSWMEITRSETEEKSPLKYSYDFITEDQLGNIWLASHFGYSCFNPIEKTFTHFNPDKEAPNKYGTNAWNMLCDKDGMIWFGAYYGLFRIDPRTKQVEQMTNGTAEITKTFFPLCVELDGTIWFNSIEGLYTCERGSTDLKPMKTSQPTHNYFLYFKGEVLSDEEILFMSNYELFWHNKRIHGQNTPVVPPLVNWVSSGDTVVVTTTAVIQLSSDHNYFIFSFSSPTEASHDNIEYQYMVVGLDNDWVNASGSRTASYNDLSGGNYMIRVRARLPNGEWTEMKRPLNISIAMRYYETTTFKAGIIIILLILLAVVFYWRRKTEYRITQDRAIASFIKLSGELGFDELCKQLVNSLTSDLRYNLAALYLMDDAGNFVLRSRQSSKRTDVEFPVSIVCGKNETSVTVIHKMNRALSSVKSAPWDILPVEQDGAPIALITLAEHTTPLSGKGDKRTVEKLIALFNSVLVNYRAEQEMKKKEEMLAHINALLSESQLVSLRAQMNPHFVFNCLNSIQQSIVMKQYNEAGTYLNKFSRLFRMVLNNSSRSLIALEEEINVLTLYLELEHMRFQEKFDYHIDVSEELDVEEIMIPSMLLQPFVENALWHGLMHKENDRHLDIRFFMRDDEVFVCEIEDNGIGRERAAEIKRMKAETKVNESKGIKISTDRLNLISMQQGKHAAVFFVDKKDESGSSTGTLIRFELSAFLN